MSIRSYRPKQRDVRAEVLVPAGWIEGTFAVPESQSFMDFVASGGIFLKMIDVRLPRHGQPVAFFALQRSAVSLIAPESAADQVETEGSAGITSPWSIACLFDQGVLQGRLDFLTNQRLSDYLRQQSGFLVVRDAVWSPAAAGSEDPAEKHWPIVVVNVARLQGISEDASQPSPGHPGKLPTEWE